MQPKHPAWDEENEHLKQTLSVVEGEKQKMERSLGVVNGEDKLVQVQDDSTNESVAALFAMRSKLRTLRQLRLSEHQPYFARLDFTPDVGAPVYGDLKPGQRGDLYIGRWGVLKTPEYKLCVADWRSPVANLYYSGQLGRVSYDAPDGLVEGELKLKRMLGVEDGELKSVQDTGLAEQEQYLIDALNQLSAPRLREVVTTIQAEQNTVIRFDPLKPLCVQGVAGSGKTTIALHRIAWILYRLQKTVLPRQMMILAPNPLFLSYISRVLPDLGIDDVRQTTFAGLCGQLLGKRMPKLTQSLRLPERLQMTKAQRDSLDDVLRRKGALSLRDDISRFLSQYERRCFPTADLPIGQDVLMTAAELERCFLNDLRHFPLDARRLELRKMVALRLKAKLGDAENAIRRAADERLDALLRRLPDGAERRARATKLLDSRDERLKQLKLMPKKYLAAFDQKWQSTELLPVYEAFLRDMAERDPAYQPVLDATLPALAKGRAVPEDLPALLLLARGLYGLPRQDIKHVVIDEAQDASPLEIAVLRDVFCHDAFTLVGDLCQGIYGDEGIRSWEDLSQGIFTAPPTVVRLSVAYRSTMEIMNLAFGVIARHPVASAGQAKPLLRHGQKPTVKRVKADRQRAQAVVEQVQAWLGEGFGSIAVVVKTARAAAALYKAISADVPQARLTTQGDDAFMGGVQVMDASVVKGLEFDCALIADAQADTYPDERFYAKLFYVLCTRPLHRLAFVSAGDVTRHLEGYAEGGDA